MSVIEGKNVLLGVTGGISAYKAAELCRLLRKAGATVRVVMTRAAGEFITPLAMQTLSGHPVAQALLSSGEEASIGHIRLADEADVVVVAPATADAIARLAAGLADDLLAAIVLATRAPVLLAPAMNVNMWDNPLTQANLARLLGTGRFATVGPDAGDLACGWIGAGRLVEPVDIVAAVEERLRLVAEALSGAALSGRTVVVTAGPTREAIDDVRFIGNRSSGKMGFAIAASAARLGARVTLVAGPVALPTPAGIVRRIDVESAIELRDVVVKAAREADVVAMAAAVADFRPSERVRGKLSRRDGPAASIALLPNPDVLAELRRSRRGARPLLVGFAAEIGAKGEALVERARKKLVEKGCDVVVANDVGAKGLGFGSDLGAVSLVFRDGGAESLPAAPKSSLALAIWERLLPLLPGSARRRHLRAT